MKKELYISIVLSAFLFTLNVFANDRIIDSKAKVASEKKVSEMTKQLSLSDQQVEQVQELLYTAYETLNSIQQNDNLTKAEKIVKYNQNGEQMISELKKVLNVEQFEKYLKPTRGYVGTKDD